MKRKLEYFWDQITSADL